MQKIHFSIEIKASKEKVWKVLWEDATFRDWTSVFAEGSHAISDWKEGSKIQFIDPKSNAGMSSIIEKLVPNEFISFKHITEIKDGEEQPLPEWSGAMEEYTLKEQNGATKLIVELDSVEEYKEMFEDKFPKGLQRVKELSEKSSKYNMKLNIYLNFAGNTEEAFSFYKSIFGRDFNSLVRFKDMPIEGVNISKEDENKIMHISLPLGDIILMGTDVLESLGQKLIQGNNTYISIHPESREEADKIFEALSENGKVEMPMAIQPWGDYYGSCTDKFGVQWMINYHREKK